jgi:hypothetical protein
VVISEAGLAQVQDDNRAVVYVVNAELTVEARNVMLGVRMPGEVEIRTGLRAGELVMVEGCRRSGRVESDVGAAGERGSLSNQERRRAPPAIVRAKGSEMILSRVSIQRPVLASMMSLALVLFGFISMTRLPVRELPDIDPPIVSVSTVYPGANAAVVETEVTERLEEAINNIEGIKTLTSQSREQVSNITIEFDLSRNIDLAAQDVRDRVARVRGRFAGVDPGTDRGETGCGRLSGAVDRDEQRPLHAPGTDDVGGAPNQEPAADRDRGFVRDDRRGETVCDAALAGCGADGGAPGHRARCPTGLARAECRAAQRPGRESPARDDHPDFGRAQDGGRIQRAGDSHGRDPDRALAGYRRGAGRRRGGAFVGAV